MVLPLGWGPWADLRHPAWADPGTRGLKDLWLRALAAGLFLGDEGSPLGVGTKTWEAKKVLENAKYPKMKMLFFF